MGIFDFLSSGNEKAAMKKQQAGLNAGRDVAYGELDKGQAAYDSYAGKAYDEYDPYADIGASGATAYSNALGLWGDAGAAAAKDNFEKSLGYDFNRDEALQAVERSASAGGYLGSGNLATALQDRASGLASTESNGWLDRIRGLMDTGVNIAGNRANILTGQGANAAATSGAKAQVGWNTETGIGQAGAEYEKSKDQAGQNIFDLLSGGLSLAGKFSGVGGFAPKG